MHQGNLLFDYLFAVFLMLHRRAIEVEVFGVDRLLVQYLVKLGAQIFHPVVPLRVAAMVAQRLDIYYPGNISGSSAVFLPANDLPAMIDDKRAAAESVYRQIAIRI